MLVGAPVIADAAVTDGAATIAAGDPFVPYADSADLLLVGPGAGTLVERVDAKLEAQPSVDASRRLFTVTPNDAIRTLSVEEQQQAFDRGVLGSAAQLLGLAAWLLDTTVEYVSQRHQFGVPIGSQQAIKHKLADVRVALEFARPLTYRAAYSLTHADPAAPVHVSMAKARAGDAAALAVRHSLQCHGAIGYSFEHDLHLWIKRVWALGASWGDAAWHRERVARAIL